MTNGTRRLALNDFAGSVLETRLPRPRHFVYVVHEAGDAEKCCKIGTAGWIPYRLQHLQCGNPRTLILAGAWNVRTIGEARRIERGVKHNIVGGSERRDWLPRGAEHVCLLVESMIAGEFL